MLTNETKTFMLRGTATKAEKNKQVQTIERKWYVIDAAGKPLGRTAVAAANILRGKHRPEFTPHVDCGEFVIIVNADKAILTGKKLEQKYYRHHSGYIGGLKVYSTRPLWQPSPRRLWSLQLRVCFPRTPSVLSPSLV